MIDQYPSPNGVLTSLIWRKTMSGGETSLSGYDNASQVLSYTPGQEQVYLNGILLVREDDYTATNGTSITGLSALSASDLVQVNCYNNFSVATLPASGITGTISSGNLPSSSTSLAGIVQLTDSTSSTSTTTAATPNAVKSAYDLANGAIQKTLTTTTGDIIYASSANTPARLGIGSSSQVLTVSGGVPTWQTPAGSGGMTLLSTTTLSGTSTTISSISGSYTNLYVLIKNMNISGDSSYSVQANGSGNANIVGMEQWSGTAYTQAGSGYSVGYCVNNMKAGDTRNVAELFIYNYAASGSYKPFNWIHQFWTSNATQLNEAGAWSGVIVDTNAITSLVLKPNPALGYSWAGGTVLIYGVN